MLVTHYFEMDIALPCSTLALAVGWLPYREGPIATVPTQDGSTRQIPCRIVAAPSLIDKAADQLLHHIHTYVEAACELLGPYPFDRLDLLILPRCFACMGLKRYGKYKFETSIVFEQLHSMTATQHNTQHFAESAKLPYTPYQTTLYHASCHKNPQHPTLTRPHHVILHFVTSHHFKSHHITTHHTTLHHITPHHTTHYF